MQMKNPIFKVCFSLSLRLLLVVENLRLVSPHLPFRFSSFPVPHAAHDTGSWTLSFTLLPDIFYARRPRLFYMYVSGYIFFLGLFILLLVFSLCWPHQHTGLGLTQSVRRNSQQ